MSLTYLKNACWAALERDCTQYLISNADGREDGALKAHMHDQLCRFMVAAIHGGDTDSVRLDFDEAWHAVHDGTQALTDHLDTELGFPVSGRPEYETMVPKFFDRFFTLAMTAMGIVVPDGWTTTVNRLEVGESESGLYVYGTAESVNAVRDWMIMRDKQATDSVKILTEQLTEKREALMVLPEGFELGDIADTANSLLGYEKTIAVGHEDDAYNTVESTTAYASRFLQAFIKMQAAIPKGWKAKAVLIRANGDADVTNKMKRECIGEFHVDVDEECQDCGGSGFVDDGLSQTACTTCDNEGTVTNKKDIPWTTIKDIYKRMVAFAGVRQMEGVKS
jgi:hypothetical protein